MTGKRRCGSLGRAGGLEVVQVHTTAFLKRARDRHGHSTSCVSVSSYISSIGDFAVSSAAESLEDRWSAGDQYTPSSSHSPLGPGTK
jgi:hypothetical protein